MRFNNLKELYNPTLVKGWAGRSKPTISPYSKKEYEGIGPGKYEYVLSDYCSADSPNGTGFICTRAKGHSGPHEAQYGDKSQCCAPWPNEDDTVEVPLTPELEDELEDYFSDDPEVDG